LSSLSPVLLTSSILVLIKLLPIFVTAIFIMVLLSLLFTTAVLFSFGTFATPVEKRIAQTITDATADWVKACVSEPSPHIISFNLKCVYFRSIDGSWGRPTMPTCLSTSVHVSVGRWQELRSAKCCRCNDRPGQIAEQRS
jgi:hypothetical protein